LTDGVDAPAESGAGADVTAPAETGPGAGVTAPSEQHLVTARPARRYRVRRGVLAALAIAVLASVIVIERHTLAESLHVLAHLNWAWFLLALACETISLFSFGLSRKLLLQVNGRPARFSTVMAITYAANALSISIPFAGAELALVFSYRQFRRHGVDAATTGWMLAVSAIFSTSALALLLAIGALAGNASLASAAGFLGAIVFILPAAAVLLALRFENVRRLLHQVIAWLVGLSRSILGVPTQGVDGLDKFLDRVASLRLPRLRYAEVFGLAVLNWTADCGALACAIKAAGQPVPWHSLLLVYGAGAAVGSTGITPGGFALVELALTAALTAAGLHRSTALAAVLAYRLVNFWMILIGGWILMALLAHRPGAPGERAPDSPGPGGLGAPARHARQIGHADRSGIRSASGAGPALRRRAGLLGTGPGHLAGHRV
jgi:putative heme transporter